MIRNDAGAGCMQRELMHISRDALAGVLGVTGERGTRIEGIRCIDLRRHDERALYGSIPGSDLMDMASTLHHFLYAADLDKSRTYAACHICSLLMHGSNSQNGGMQESRPKRQTGRRASDVCRQQSTSLPDVKGIHGMQALHMCQQTSCQLR